MPCPSGTGMHFKDALALVYGVAVRSLRFAAFAAKLGAERLVCADAAGSFEIAYLCLRGLLDEWNILRRQSLVARRARR